MAGPAPEPVADPAAAEAPAAAAPAAADPPAAFRMDRNAPRNRSAPAEAPELPPPPLFLPPVSAGPGCAGNGTTRVASNGGSGSAGFRSGAWITAVSIARAPASSRRWAGSLFSRP